MTTTTPPETIVFVRRMKGQGKRNAEIAEALMVPTRKVEKICERYRIMKPSGSRLDVPIGAQLNDRYHREAEKRGIPFNRFVRELLLVIASDNLFTAILDDKK